MEIEFETEAIAMSASGAEVELHLIASGSFDIDRRGDIVAIYIDTVDPITQRFTSKKRFCLPQASDLFRLLQSTIERRYADQIEERIFDVENSRRANAADLAYACEAATFAA